MAETDNRSSEKEEARLHVILTKEQKQELRVRAAKAGKSNMSDYVRDVLFGREQRAVAA